MTSQRLDGSPRFSLRSRADLDKLFRSLALSLGGFLLVELAGILANLDVPDGWTGAVAFASFALNGLRLWLTDTRAIVPFWLAALMLMPVSAQAHPYDRKGQAQAPLQRPSPPGSTPGIANSGRIIILRDAWFGPHRIRGRSIPVKEIAPGIYLERGKYHWLDPLGVFTR